MVVWEVSHHALQGSSGQLGFLRESTINAVLAQMPSRAGSSVSLLRAAPPMSPALRCVVSLTVLFFSVYLAAVLARLFRVAAPSGPSDERHLKAVRVERALVQATEALALVPMLCVLMIGIRIRAVQLGFPNGDPPRWIQLCMYAQTAAFFVRFLLNLLPQHGLPGGSSVQRLRQAVFGLASLILYGGCAVIACGIVSLAMPSRLPASQISLTRFAGPTTPQLSVMQQCMMILAVSYILECLTLEALKAMGHLYGLSAAQKKLTEAEDLPIKRKYSDGDPGTAREAYGKIVEALADEQKPMPTSVEAAADATFLQFPLMLCVLFLGMSLRATQLRLQPDPWACLAMYVTTVAIVSWAAWGVAARMEGLEQLMNPPASLVPSCLGRWTNGSGQQEPESDTCAKVKGGFAACRSTSWVCLMAVVYAGTALIIVSLAVMEAKPVWPEVKSRASTALLWMFAAAKATSSAPALSTAMRCVMWLTVLYFGVHMCLMAGRFARGRIANFVEKVVEGIQRSLVFVPMLCIMMVAVRLRAMQLKIRDPQPWAQVAMVVASWAVFVQVLCSLSPVAADDCDHDADSKNLCSKIFSVILLLLRQTAAATFYFALAMLIMALLVMEPETKLP